MAIEGFSYSNGYIPPKGVESEPEVGVKKNNTENKESIGPPPDYPAPPPPEQSAQKTHHFVKGMKHQLKGRSLPDSSAPLAKRRNLNNRVTKKNNTPVKVDTPKQVIAKSQTQPLHQSKRFAGKLVRTGTQASFIGARGNALFTNRPMPPLTAAPPPPAPTAAEVRSSSGKAQFAKQIVEELINSSNQLEEQEAFTFTSTPRPPFGRSTALSEDAANALKQLPETASKEELNSSINTSSIDATEKLALAKKLTEKAGAPINPENTVKLEKLFASWSESYLDNKNTPADNEIPNALQSKLEENKEAKVQAWKENIAALSETDQEFLQGVLTLHQNVATINGKTQPANMGDYKAHLGISMMLQPLLLSGTALRNQRAEAMTPLSAQIKDLGPKKGEKPLKTQVEELNQELAQVQAKMKKRFARTKKLQRRQGEITSRTSSLNQRIDDIAALEKQISEIQEESKVAGFAQNGAMEFLVHNWDEINSN